jgi:16S rRNA (guanine527-N7)-methyltransferase
VTFHVEHSPSPLISLPPEFQRICARNHLLLSNEQLILLARFVDGVIEWNSKINLISRRDQENIWFSHVLHSLGLLFCLDLPLGLRVLDLGTGGGFPGIPIRIARPDIEIVLLDSIRKKTLVVQDLVERLGLTGVSVKTGRVEELSRGGGGIGKFDLVVARAVASLRDLVRWSRPCLKAPGGEPWESQGGNKLRLVSPCLVALKGGELEREIAEARTKESVRFVRVIEMGFEGSVELGWEDKRAVITGL